MAEPLRSLTMVYDADGSLAGEVRYVIGHLLGRAHCDLCDITHGGLRRKRAFDELVASLPVPVEVLHRDEQSAEVAAVTRGHLACVVARTDTGLEIVLDRDALAACEGRVDRLGERLRAALAGRS